MTNKALRTIITTGLTLILSCAPAGQNKINIDEHSQKQKRVMIRYEKPYKIPNNPEKDFFEDERNYKIRLYLPGNKTEIYEIPKREKKRVPPKEIY